MNDPDNILRLRATANLWIGGVQTGVKLLLGPAYDDRGQYGLIVLSAFPEEVAMSFRLEGGRAVAFWDVADHGLDQRLAQVFKLPADKVGRYCRELAVEMITDILTRPAGQPSVEPLLFSASAFDLLNEALP